MDLKKMTFKVATATNAKSVSWKNRTYTWEELVKRFTSAKVTEETYREFMAASKAEQGAIKEAGNCKNGDKGLGCPSGRIGKLLCVFDHHDNQP